VAGFATYRVQQLRPPCAGPFDETLAAVLGKMQDDELALLRVAALSRVPAKCPDDALDLVGGWFLLPRFPGESNDTYRARLVAAWPTYDVSGAPDGLVESLQAYGFVDVAVLRAEDIGYATANYSAFTVKLGPDNGTTGIADDAWGSFTWGGTKTWGSTATIAQVTAIMGQVIRWKGAHGLPLYIDIQLDGGMFGGTTIRIDLINVWGSWSWGDGTPWGTGRWLWG
jgi:hypothetical protein